MKIAQIENNRIHKIYTADEASWYPEGVLVLRQIPDEAQEGWVWDAETEAWVEPISPSAKLDPVDILGLALMDVYEQQQQNQERTEAALMDLYEAVLDNPK